MAFSAPLIANSISGPSRVCPGQTVTYDWNPSFNIQNCAVSPMWRLKQNGVVLLAWSNPSLNSWEWGSDWTFVWPNTTSPGTVTIEVESLLCCIICDEEDWFNVTVGLAQPTNILGTENICPNSSSGFSLAAVPYATSYTWTVPNGWKVNGISGPDVPGQTNNVQITSPTTGFGTYPIKVKAVSSSCGISAQTTRQQKLDYPVQLFAGPPSDYAEFVATPPDQNSYTWLLPSTWRKIYQQYNEIFVDTKGTPGTITVQVSTLCNNTIASQVYFNPNGLLNAVINNDNGVYPNPTGSELKIIDATSPSVTILNSSGEYIGEKPLDPVNLTVDLKELTPGFYYVHYERNHQRKVARIKKE